MFARIVMALWIFLSFFVNSFVLAQTTPTPDATTVVADCSKILPTNRPMPTGFDAPSIRITEPTQVIVYGTLVTVSIETTNFDITTEGRHWHLWVNGQLQGMVYQPTGIIELAPGDYEICASLGNTDHADIGVPAGIHITVKEAAAGTPTATLPVAPGAARVLPETVSPGQIALLVGAGLVAAVGGWWLGARMGKKRKS